MKHILITLFCCSLSFMTLHAQTMKELFVSMPDTLSLIFTPVNRADCVDFLASGIRAQVTNRFNNPSEVTNLTDNYLRAQITESSVWEMRTLPVKDSVSVICFVKTVKAPVEDSHILFYTQDWQPLPTSDFLSALPTADDFFRTDLNESQTDSLNELREQAYITFIKASLSPTEDTLSFTYTTPEYMNREERDKINAYLRKTPITYIWKDKHFIRKD